LIRLCALGSGSSGNCVYVGNGGSALLLDAGFSGKEISSRLKTAGIDAESIRGVVVSHEHSDHVKGVGVIARVLKIPVYVNEKTYQRIKKHMGKVPDVVRFNTGEPFEAAGIEVAPFSIPHDAADPCAFIFRSGEAKVAVVTDAGSETTLIEEKLLQADYIMIEANHDVEMLKAGPYPWPVKQRIASQTGHLSNEACAGLLGKVAGADLQGVMFAHLSTTNNNPDLVRLMAGQILQDAGIPHIVAEQNNPSAMVYVE